MTIAIEARELTRTYGQSVALNGATFSIQKDSITGILGRNGSGKTTMMSLLTGQDRPTSGEAKIFGHDPFERADVVEQMCFVRDNQRYPDEYSLKQVLRAGAVSFPNWDQAFADRLVTLFRIPMKTPVKKLSRGQFSSVGIVLGLASRAPITFFDEPYLGLDATSRVNFYDVLLQDVAEHPRTVIVSTHLISEMEQILEHVIILDEGRILHEAEVEDLRGAYHQVAGRTGQVEAYLAGRTIVSRRTIGGLVTAVVTGSGDDDAARRYDVDLTPVGLQELVAAFGVGSEPAAVQEGTAS